MKTLYAGVYYLSGSVGSTAKYVLFALIICSSSTFTFFWLYAFLRYSYYKFKNIRKKIIYFLGRLYKNWKIDFLIKKYR